VRGVYEYTIKNALEGRNAFFALMKFFSCLRIDLLLAGARGAEIVFFFLS
jgi:hypothetical protein